MRSLTVEVRESLTGEPQRGRRLRRHEWPDMSAPRRANLNSESGVKNTVNSEQREELGGWGWGGGSLNIPPGSY